MLSLKLLTAALLPLAALASQIPIIEEDRLSKVISDSLFLSLHRDLCKISSVTNEEYHIGKWVKDLLEAHHFKVITQEVPPNPSRPKSKKPRLNIYSYPDPSFYKSSSTRAHQDSKPPHPKVLLTSHIDTVPPHFPYGLSYRHSGGAFNRSNVLISGRGTVDDKACVATQITIAMDLLIHPPTEDFDPTDVAILFVVDEEAGGMGMRHFSASDLYAATNKNYKAVVFGEPTERKLVSGHKGIFQLRIDAHGKAAHSGYPWLGRSATSMILPALLELEELQTRPAGKGGLPSSAKFGNTTINIGLMQGGVAANVVPEHAFAEIAFRLAAGTPAENRAIVRKAVRKVDPKGLLKLDFGDQEYGPVNFDTDVPGFETIVVNYGTDAPGLDVKKGVKRYLYGPGSIFVAHGANEALTVGELEAGLEGYKKLVAHALKL